MNDRHDVPIGLGISPGRAEELRDLTLKIVQDESIVSTTDAVKALMHHIPKENTNELAFACVELGYALGKSHNIRLAVIGMTSDPLHSINTNNGFKQTVGQA